MTWQLLLLISILAASLKGILFRSLMRQDASDPWAQSIAFLAVSGTLSLLIALVKGFQFPDFPRLLPNFALMIFLLTLAPVLTFRAFKLTGAAETVIFLQSQILWVVLGSYIFLGEAVVLGKMIGSFLMLLGLTFISLKKRKIIIGKGKVLAVGAGFLYGLSNVNGFYILRSLNAFSFEAFANYLPLLTIMLLQPTSLRKLNFYRSSANAVNLFVTASLGTVATISLCLAYQVGRNASQISPLSATSLMVTVIFAAIFLKEKENLFRKIIGSAIIIGGIILIK